MKRFQVSVFHMDDLVEDQPDKLNISLTRIFSGLIDAADAKHAATRAWIDGVGVPRQVRLDELGAPDVVRNWQTDPEGIAHHLSSTNFGLGDNWLILDVPGDFWLISIDEIEPAS